MDTKKITDERGSEYGHPRDHFHATESMFTVLEARLSQVCLQPDGLSLVEYHGVRHAMYFIVDKLVRACASPKKRDHWDDIAGYARTALMVLDLEE